MASKMNHNDRNGHVVSLQSHVIIISKSSCGPAKSSKIKSDIFNYSKNMYLGIKK